MSTKFGAADERHGTDDKRDTNMAEPSLTAAERCVDKRTGGREATADISVASALSTKATYQYPDTTDTSLEMPAVLHAAGEVRRLHVRVPDMR